MAKHIDAAYVQIQSDDKMNHDYLRIYAIMALNFDSMCHNGIVFYLKIRTV